jgi:hypothetical protein
MVVRVVRLSHSKCEPNCPEWIAASGDITENTPALFRKIFKQLGNRRLPVLLNSGGGSIEAAIQIGRMIRKRKLETGVAQTTFVACLNNDARCQALQKKGIFLGTAASFRSYCNSACPIILSGGVQRYTSYSASVGVHKPRQTTTREFIREKISWRIKNGK